MKNKIRLILSIAISIFIIILIILIVIFSYKNKQEKQQQEKENILKQQEYETLLNTPTRLEERAIILIKKIKNSLTNPKSLQLNNVSVKAQEFPSYYDKVDKIYIKIDYSAQNGFGGMNRIVHYNTITKSGELDSSKHNQDVLILFYNSTKYLETELDTERLMRFIENTK